MQVVKMTEGGGGGGHGELGWNEVLVKVRRNVFQVFPLLLSRGFCISYTLGYFLKASGVPKQQSHFSVFRYQVNAQISGQY